MTSTDRPGAWVGGGRTVSRSGTQDTQVLDSADTGVDCLRYRDQDGDDWGDETQTTTDCEEEEWRGSYYCELTDYDERDQACR